MFLNKGRLYGWNRAENFTLYDGSLAQSGMATASSYDGKRGSHSDTVPFMSVMTPPSHEWVLFLTEATCMADGWEENGGAEKKEARALNYFGEGRRENEKERKKTWKKN